MTEFGIPTVRWSDHEARDPEKGDEWRGPTALESSERTMKVTETTTATATRTQLVSESPVVTTSVAENTSAVPAQEESGPEVRETPRMLDLLQSFHCFIKSLRLDSYSTRKSPQISPELSVSYKDDPPGTSTATVSAPRKKAFPRTERASNYTLSFMSAEFKNIPFRKPATFVQRFDSALDCAAECMKFNLWSTGVGCGPCRAIAWREPKKNEGRNCFIVVPQKTGLEVEQPQEDVTFLQLRGGNYSTELPEGPASVQLTADAQANVSLPMDAPGCFLIDDPKGVPMVGFGEVPWKDLPAVGPPEDPQQTGKLSSTFHGLWEQP